MNVTSKFSSNNYKKKKSLSNSFKNLLSKSFRIDNKNKSKQYIKEDSSVNSINQNNIQRNMSLTSNETNKSNFTNFSNINNNDHVCDSLLNYSLKNNLKTNQNSNNNFTVLHNWKFVTAIKTYTDSNMKCLPFYEGQNFCVLELEDHDWFVVKDTLSNQLGRVPSQYFVPSFKYHEYSEWYIPDIKRNDAENILIKQNIHGAFIIRKSESCSENFSLSVLSKYNCVKHYKIKILNENNLQGFYIDISKVFQNMVDLVNHYSTYNDGLCCKLENTTKIKKNNLSHISKSLSQLNISNELINLINCEDLKFETRLGGGNFGEVWKTKNSQNYNFAVKILHTPTTQSIKNFINEIEILSKLNHPKIVKYYGCKIQDKNQQYWIITNLMENGNLGDYLRLEKTQNNIHFAELMYIIVQISTGMLYLHDNNIIHRDLAARNILVGHNWKSIQICDFGMACFFNNVNNIKYSDNDSNNDSNNNSNNNQTLFALKWTAPEVALKKEFSFKSDVWSFGILLFEIITYGQLPYHDLTNKETVKKVSNGYRLPQPPKCPNSIYNVMLNCWAHSPLIRPNFDCLVTYFNKVSIILKYHFPT